MSRPQIERILTLDRLIRDRQYPNADSMAAHFETSRRVVFNDRKFLVERLGAPLEFDRARRGWFYSEPSWVLPATMVTQGELLAFFLSIEVARRNLGGALEETLARAVQKIARTLPSEVEVEFSSLHAHLSFTSPTWAGADEKTLLALHQAIQGRRCVEIDYHTFSTGKRSTRVVHPHHLHNARGDWYLIAFDSSRQEMRTFHVGRIARHQVLERRFTRDLSFDAGEWHRQSFVTELSETSEDVVVRFDEYQARYIRERRWHETQSLEELPDGGLILRFRSSGLNEVRRWVMQYGAHAQVLAPLSLRQDVREEIEKMRKTYEEES